MNQQLRRGRPFWQELIQRYEAGTTQTQRQFAQAHGVSFSSFKYWLYQLRKANDDTANSGSEVPVQFIDVTPASHPPSPELSTAAMLLLPNDVILEFPSLPQPDYLATLLRSLRSS